jgi:hypothetical protein
MIWVRTSDVLPSQHLLTTEISPDPFLWRVYVLQIRKAMRYRVVGVLAQSYRSPIERYRR